MRTLRNALGAVILAMVAFTLAAGCAQIFGLKEATLSPDLCTDEALGYAVPCDAGAEDAATDAEDAGDAGDDSGLCTPGTPVECYDGPPATKDVGLCKHGTATCGPDGGPTGTCVGEVLPKAIDNCALMTDDNCDGIACSANVGGGVFDAGSVNGVAVDAMGNAFVAGTFSNTIAFGMKTLVTAGGSDLFLAKIDPTGTPIWAFSYGSVANETASFVAATPDGGVVLAGPLPLDINFGCKALSNTSTKQLDIFVVKFNADGSCQWSNVYGGANGLELVGIATDPAGEVLLAGSTEASVSFGGTAIPFSGMVPLVDFLAKLNTTNGSEVWSKSLGDLSYPVNITAVQVDPAGDVILGGQNVTAAAGASLDNGTHKFGYGMVLARFDNFGNYAWAFSAPSVNSMNSFPSVTALASDPSGNIYLTGDAAWGLQFGQEAVVTGLFLAKLDVSGTAQWSATFSGAGTLVPSDLAVDGQGSIIVTGSFQGSLSFGAGTPIIANSMESFVLKLDSSPSYLWGKSFGTATSQAVAVATVPVTNQVVIAGNVNGPGQIDFGKGPLTCPGDDAFVATFEP